MPRRPNQTEWERTDAARVGLDVHAKETTAMVLDGVTGEPEVWRIVAGRSRCWRSGTCPSLSETKFMLL